jgi:aspartate carbamoyltransferase regulatory subunit
MIDRNIIGYIENGVVVDHIPVGRVWEVARILRVDRLERARVSLGDGYDSAKINKKGILKVEGRTLSEREIDLIALLAPEASVSFIRGGRVERKKKVHIPEQLEGVVCCANSNCITNEAGEKVPYKISYRNGVFTCHYCEYEFDMNELKLNLGS